MEELVFEREAAAEYDRAFSHVTGYFEMSEKVHLQRWKGVQPVWELSEAP